MITARLNRLIKAYRITKTLFSDANRGLAVPAPVFRWCHKVRQAVWMEIKLVSNRLKLRNRVFIEAKAQASNCFINCIYPGCNCPFDMGPDHQCLRGLPVIRK